MGLLQMTMDEFREARGRGRRHEMEVRGYLESRGIDTEDLSDEEIDAAAEKWSSEPADCPDELRKAPGRRVEWEVAEHLRERGVKVEDLTEAEMNEAVFEWLTEPW
jgi:hypothetical protein